MITDFITLSHFISIFSLCNSFSCNFLILFKYIIITIHIMLFLIKKCKFNTFYNHYYPNNKYIMRKSTLKDNFKNSNSQSYYRLKKINSIAHLNTFENSRISLSSSKNSHKGIPKVLKLQNSFYNDKNYHYLNVSQTLSEKLTQYQRRQISFSQRKKYQSTHIQKVVEKRKRSVSQSNLQTKTQQNSIKQFKNKLHINQQALKSKTLCVHKQKFNNHTLLKYNKLINGSKQMFRNKKILQKDIKNILQTSNSKKWKSPFKNQNARSSKFLGKKLTTSLSVNQIDRKINPQNNFQVSKQPYQLKVMNLDRMFRQKSGKLGNIIPLPVAKLESINSRQILMNKIKQKGRIYNVIEDYNNLLRIYKRNTNKVLLGIKGHHYIQTPSIQDIIGIKLRPKTKIQKPVQGISDEVFLNNCQFFIKLIKKQNILTTRLLSGIKMQSNSINLQSFTKFYVLFVTKTSSLQQKINFLSYFFISKKHLFANIQQITQVLEIMCQKLPKIQKLNIKTDLLSDEEKSKIFLQALTRVLFSELTNNSSTLYRQTLEIILKKNSEAVDLLIKLLQLE